MTAYDYWSILLGALSTIGVSLVSIIVGVPLGLGLALIRWGRVPVARQLVFTYVSIMRSCPAVTLILLIFFALPQFGISLDPATAGILAMLAIIAFGAPREIIGLGATVVVSALWATFVLRRRAAA